MHYIRLFVSVVKWCVCGYFGGGFVVSHPFLVLLWDAWDSVLFLLTYCLGAGSGELVYSWFSGFYGSSQAGLWSGPLPSRIVVPLLVLLVAFTRLHITTLIRLC